MVSPWYSYLLVVFYWSHNLGYIYTNYASKPLREPASVLLAQWFEISPVTFLLYMQALDALTFSVWLLVLLLLFSFYLSFFCLLWLRIFRRHLIDRVHKSTLFCLYKRGANVFLRAFVWLFYIPMIEINLGMSFCGANSFLVAYREQSSCESHPWVLSTMATLGLLMTIGLAVVTVTLYRNYRFHEQHPLKKKYHHVQLV